jgi:sulfite dehydrogenase (quinone) subunit SoeC
MKPAWSVILLTTFIGAGQGLFLAVFSVDLLRADAAKTLVVASCALSLLLLASFFRLGRPERAWRAAAQWRTSWLSREVIVLPAFMGLVLLYGAMHFLESARAWVLAAGFAAAVLCIVLFVCTGMIYASLKGLREWYTVLTPLNYLLLGTSSGFTLSVSVAVLAYPQFAGVLALAAFLIGAAAYVMRCASLVRNARLRARSAPAGALRIDHARALRAARWAFLILAFPVPGLLLGWGGGSLPVCAAAFAIQFAGLLAERWHFFADVRHPQNLC